MSFSSRLVLAAALALAAPAVATADPAAPQAQISDASSKAPVQAADDAKDYAQLSATPHQFEAFAEAVGLMQKTEPNYSVNDLAQVGVPVAIVHSEHDEFIKREHAEYLARSIPNAALVNLNGVSHFAPLQRPELFNAAMLKFLGTVVR